MNISVDEYVGCLVEYQLAPGEPLVNGFITPDFKIKSIIKQAPLSSLERKPMELIEFEIPITPEIPYMKVWSKDLKTSHVSGRFVPRDAEDRFIQSISYAEINEALRETKGKAVCIGKYKSKIVLAESKLIHHKHTPTYGIKYRLKWGDKSYIGDSIFSLIKQIEND